MSNALPQDLDEQAAALRAELKEWERAFSAANDGRKAGRDDIKNDRVISAKYKAYSRLRAQSSQTSESTKESSDFQLQAHDQQKKRKRPSHTQEKEQSYATPRKASRHALSTPSRRSISNIHPSEIDPYDSPSTLRRLFSPTHHQGSLPNSPLPLRAAIGPTPQRDGKALGLFDLLSVSGGSAATPSSKRTALDRGASMQTPSRRRDLSTIDEDETITRARTPASSAKKFYLANFFATPPNVKYSAAFKTEYADQPIETENERGSGGNAPGSDTPSFLRRRNLFSSSNPRHARGKIHDLSPVAVRMPQKLVGKGLSAIVQGLRDIQEERLDEDLDILREIEAEQAGQHDNVVINDSQAPGDPDALRDADGTMESPAKRQWKKKGQKRTTRRVIMRPTRTKPKPAPAPEQQAPDEEESEDELAAVLETQHVSSTGGDEKETNEDAPHDSDLEYLSGSDSNYEDIQPTSPSRARKPAHNTDPAGKSDDTKTKQPAKPGRPKKVNPEAHANYRALKIRGKGSKARGRMGGRFGRRGR
ncbi:DNA replication regulator sld2 [Emmonsiellopsis sp. PD_33]|nr:DNA replication regulator sld2 [Emmonsiellopsis sp. PD_33]